MSSQFSTALISISLLAIALAANQADQNGFDDAAIASKRGPAVAAMATDSTVSKEERLGPFKEAPALKHTEKAHGPIDVRLEYVGGLPAAVGDVFVVRGIVSARESLQGVDFQWSLPDGVELVNGAKQGRLDSVSTDQPAAVELTLKKTAPGKFKIHLLAGVSHAGGRFADAAQLDDSGRQVEMRNTKKATPGGTRSYDSVKIFH